MNDELQDGDEEMEVPAKRPETDDPEDDAESLAVTSRMNYSVESGYMNEMLGDIYSPEAHYDKTGLQADLQVAFGMFLERHQQYGFLRSIDVNRITPGDKACYIRDITLDEGVDLNNLPATTMVLTTCVVAEVTENDMLLIDGDARHIRVSRTQVQPVDDYISRLKAHDIAHMYVNIRRYMRGMEIKNVCREIELFDVFTSYFRIHERMLYTSLPLEVQQDLLAELNDSTGVFKKRNVNPMW